MKTRVISNAYLPRRYLTTLDLMTTHSKEVVHHTSASSCCFIPSLDATFMSDSLV